MEFNIDLVRLEAEQCDRVEDFLFFTSQAGGAASGLILNFLPRIEFIASPKPSIVMYSVVPEPSSLGSEVVTALNNILAMHEKQSVRLSDVWVDNGSLYRVCER